MFQLNHKTYVIQYLYTAQYCYSIILKLPREDYTSRSNENTHEPNTEKKIYIYSKRVFITKYVKKNKYHLFKIM